LTPDEQYTHFSLWCLQASPLLIGYDFTQLDPFTLGLLTNDEVIDVDQDELGTAANLVRADPAPAGADQAGVEVWTRPLADGSVAVGLFNLGKQPTTVHVTWDKLHLTGSWKVRDLWRQKGLGTFAEKFESEVPAHGVILLKLSNP
jgi:alpha-galactosidase